MNRGVFNKEFGDDLLSHTKSTLSLARIRFTALFEKGRGGSKSLLSPNITGNVMHGAEPGITLASACFNKLEEVKDSSVRLVFNGIRV